MAWSPRPIPTQKKKTSIAVPMINQGIVIGGKIMTCSKRFALKSCLKKARATAVPIKVERQVLSRATVKLFKVAECSLVLLDRASYHRVLHSIGIRYNWDSLNDRAIITKIGTYKKSRMQIRYILLIHLRKIILSDAREVRNQKELEERAPS